MATKVVTKHREALEAARRRTALQVDTVAHAVTSVDDAVGWTRLTELGTASTVRAQQVGVSATAELLNAALDAVGAVADIVDLPGIEPGRLASGRDVAGMFAKTQNIVRARMAGGQSFPEALDASANVLTAIASSEPHRVARDGQFNTGLSDSRFDRYRRVAVGTTCAFCRMLATRGAVYLTAESAGRGRQYHYKCDCYVELVPADDIAGTTGLQGDWRNAISEPGRTRMRRNGSQREFADLPDSAVEELARSGSREATAELAARQAFDARAVAPGVAPEVPAIADAGGWQPGKWSEVSPDEALFAGVPDQLAAIQRRQAELAAKFDALRAKPKKQRPVVHAMTNGNKSIVSQQKLSKDQLAGLLADFDEAVAAMPADLRGRPVSLMVPVGDSHFKSGAGGYVIGGTPRIHIKPAIAKGAEQWDNPAMGRPVDGIQYGHHMPASVPGETRRDVIMHEMGHVVDDMKQHTGVTSSWEKEAKYAEEAFWSGQVADLPARMYAQKNAAEGYAEFFMQYRIGGPGSNPIADAYAARYGW